MQLKDSSNTVKANNERRKRKRRVIKEDSVDDTEASPTSKHVNDNDIMKSEVVEQSGKSLIEVSKCEILRESDAENVLKQKASDVGVENDASDTATKPVDKDHTDGTSLKKSLRKRNVKNDENKETKKPRRRNGKKEQPSDVPKSPPVDIDQCETKDIPREQSSTDQKQSNGTVRRGRLSLKNRPPEESTSSQEQVVPNKIKSLFARVKNGAQTGVKQESSAQDESAGTIERKTESDDGGGKKLAEDGMTYVSRAPALLNLGNTCFLNCVLQLVYYTPALVDCVAILSAEIHSTDKDRRLVAELNQMKGSGAIDVTKVPLVWKFILHLNELLEKMKRSAERFKELSLQQVVPALSPTDLLTTLLSLNPLFEEGRQQDAHEMLNCVFSYIQEATRLVNETRDDIRLLVHNSRRTCLPVGGDRSADKNTLESSIESGSMPSVHEGKTGSLRTGAHGDAGSKLPKPDSESKPAVKKSRPITSFFSIAVKPKTAEDMFDQVVDQLTTQPVVDPVDSLCQGSLEERTRCVLCEGVVQRSEFFRDISLPVDSTSHRQVEGGVGDASGSDEEVEKDLPGSWIFRVLDEVERLRAENKYWCSACEHLEEAERSVRYIRTPNLLFLHLKRFAAFGSFLGGFVKKMDCVGIPLSLPCLEESCRHSEDGPPAEHHYELSALISHSGTSLSSGHYITYVRSLSPTLSAHKIDVTTVPTLQRDGMLCLEKCRRENSSPEICIKTEVDENCLDAPKRCEDNSRTKRNGCEEMNANDVSHSIDVTELTGRRAAQIKSEVSEPAKLNDCRKVENKMCVIDSQACLCGPALGDIRCTCSAVTSAAAVSRADTLWYECDDDQVTELTEQQFVAMLAKRQSATPYILLYKRV